MGQIGRFNEVVIDCFTYLQSNEHVSLQGVCVGVHMGIHITVYVHMCCVSASLSSDSQHCGLCSVFKAHAQTTDLSCPEVLVVQPLLCFFPPLA